MITLHPHKWLHLKQGTTKHLQAMLSWSLGGTAEMPLQKDRYLLTWGLRGLGQAQSVKSPQRYQNCHLRKSSYTQRIKNPTLSFHTFLAHSPWSWGGIATNPSCIICKFTKCIICKSTEWFTSGEGRTRGGESATMIGSKKKKKNFLEIKVFNIKRVSIWKSENRVSWRFLSWIVPTAQKSNCLNDTLLFAVYISFWLCLSSFVLCFFLLLLLWLILLLLSFLSYLPCLTPPRGSQQCPQATMRSTRHQNHCWRLS